MSQPIFPGIEQIMTILMGEMPSGPYATDRADNIDPTLRSYSSSEIRAHAQVFANLYANLEDIYENKFITTVQPDEIGLWEKNLFSAAQDASQPFAVRQANLLAKYRAQGGLSLPYIQSLVAAILDPLGLSFRIITYNCGFTGGGWILDTTPLDVSTYLAFGDPLIGVNPGGAYSVDCNAIINLYGIPTLGSPVITGVPTSTSGIVAGAGISGEGIPAGATVVSVTTNTITMSANATATETLTPIEIKNYYVAGLTDDEFTSIQQTAYTYEVQIYGTASAATLSQLDQILTQSEKATVTHVISNNYPMPIDGTLVDMGPFLADTLVDNINFGMFTWPGATYDIWDFGAF